MKMNHKVSIVTGGSGGIGLETARQFNDGIVLITDINERGLEKGKKELEASGIRVETMLCDVSKRADVESMLEKAASLGTIERVVHTAGLSASHPNPRLIINIDLLGTANLLEALLPYAHDDLSLVCIASMMGFTIPPSSYDHIMIHCLEEGNLDKLVEFSEGDPSKAYNISKRGVHLLCEKWAQAYGDQGARVNSVSPGIIETPMALAASRDFPEQMQYMQSMTPLSRNGQAIDVANVIGFLCSPMASFITGTDILVDGGLIKKMIRAQKRSQEKVAV
jgi:NAD(P)-dependent dehydrogenase (short-subunit alcohol dehydrogenase family)